ncbi:Ovate protein family [Macleaya cordata]|uniref:Transcription repressor n=1 Tax=Macleaya cordata TaxID=56857 RepID=A0A200RB45_MACCD|nr:Ovate protein family [Macleaya cordata]
MDAMKDLKKMRKKNSRHFTTTLSFSASLPNDVRGVYADSICAVKYSNDPYKDLKLSILEMIRDVGVRSWEEMEELVYCYVVLNSSEIHGFIGDAFLSLF